MAVSANEALIAYDWPGNVRQLARVIERAIALAPLPEIVLSDLPADISRDFRPLVRETSGRDESLRAWSSGTSGSCSSAAAATSGARAMC
jgi:transcriptional regulator of acetoin/glycerol metabolism